MPTPMKAGELFRAGFWIAFGFWAFSAVSVVLVYLVATALHWR
jgi:hypothetical protein